MYNKIAPHKKTRLAASGVISTVAAKFYGVLLFGGSTATSLKLTNDTSGAGTAELNFNIPIGESRLFDFSYLGPVMFSTAMYGTLAGTGAEAYLFWE